MSEITKKELYQIALDTRNFEISLFWQRSNYFLALNTAIAVGFFVKASAVYQFGLGFFGLLTSILWVAINCGSKFWQSRWETRLKIAEDNLSKDINYFSTDWETLLADAQKSIDFSNHNFLRKYFDRFVLAKPSVSFVMTLLSVLFVLFWIILIIISIQTPPVK